MTDQLVYAEVSSGQIVFLAENIEELLGKAVERDMSDEEFAESETGDIVRNSIEQIREQLDIVEEKLEEVSGE